MEKLLTAVATTCLLATPALAQPADSEKPAKQPQPQACQMMHNGTKMQGMMVQGEDGKMTCQPMNQSQMQHGAMNHEQMGQGQMPQGMMNHEQMGQGMMDHGQTGHDQHAGKEPK